MIFHERYKGLYKLVLWTLRYVPSYYGCRSIFRRIIIPIGFSFRKIFFPKGYYSEDFFFIPKGYYSKTFVPKGRYSETRNKTSYQLSQAKPPVNMLHKKKEHCQCNATKEIDADILHSQNKAKKDKLVGTLFSAFRGAHLLFTSDWARLLNTCCHKRITLSKQPSQKMNRFYSNMTR